MTGTMLDIKEMRHALMATYINVVVVLQIRAMREQRGWSQGDLARELGKAQSQVSQWEKIPWDNWPTLTSLQEIAAVFDVALEVRFRPWTQAISEFLGEYESAGLSSKSLAVASWEEEYSKLAAEFSSAAAPQEKPE